MCRLILMLYCLDRRHCRYGSIIFSCFSVIVQNVSEVFQVLIQQLVQGILIDKVIAEARPEFFGNSEIVLRKQYQLPDVMKGFVMSGVSEIMENRTHDFLEQQGKLLRSAALIEEFKVT